MVVLMVRVVVIVNIWIKVVYDDDGNNDGYGVDCSNDGWWF
mgnify:CR=1 FL=1